MEIPDITQYTILGAIAIYLVKEGVSMFKYVLSKYNPPDEKLDDTNYSKDMAKGIALISENHLNHIEEAIREQTRQTHDDHQKQYEILCQINANIKK